MHRRQFLASTAGFTAALATMSPLLARQASPVASSFPRLELAFTDAAFQVPEGVQAGRYELVVTNTGSITDSHFALGRIPDAVTDAQYEEWIQGHGADTEAMSFEDIAFVGAADWPQPGGAPVTGVIDLHPGRYIAAPIFSDQPPTLFTVAGTFPEGVEEPAADFTVTLHEMTIDLPKAAFTSSPVRWKIENTGSFHHEVAVLATPPELDADMFMTVMSLPENATPPPGMPEFVYQPTAAIGILAPGGTSWLDVRLAPGHYLAACMLPFGTGYPHAMDGMFVFFDVP